MNDSAESPVLESRRWNFSLRDLLVLMVALGVLFAIATPAIQHARDASRQNLCKDHLKELGLALHQHWSVFKRFPRQTTTTLYQTVPGSGSSAAHPGAGYSWIVAVAPYINGLPAGFSRLVIAPTKVSVSAFDGETVDGATGLPLWAMHSSVFLCPAFSGSQTAIAPEYARYKGIDHNSKPYGMATANYAALTATQLACITAKPGSTDWNRPDGWIIPEQGRSLIDLVDGSSKTLIVAESRESAYSSWWDGTSVWIVAADTTGPQPFRAWFDGSKRINSESAAVQSLNARWYLETKGRTSLQVGPSRATPGAVYLRSKDYPGMQNDRMWGPSSEHASGAVNHLTADGAVHEIMPDIDPTLYLQLTTRAGREPVSLP